MFSYTVIVLSHLIHAVQFRCLHYISTERKSAFHWHNRIHLTSTYHHTLPNDVAWHMEIILRALCKGRKFPYLIADWCFSFLCCSALHTIFRDSKRSKTKPNQTTPSTNASVILVPLTAHTHTTRRFTRI